MLKVHDKMHQIQIYTNIICQKQQGITKLLKVKILMI